MTDTAESPSSWPWPAPVADGGADHLEPGTRLPDIALSATPGAPVNLARCSGRAVVFIYPWTGRADLPNPPDWDHIPGAHGSTPQAEGFAALHRDFLVLGCPVYGLSTQETAHHTELSTRLRLPFPLLSDADFAFADALRLPRFTTGGVTYLRRLTLLIAGGTIEAVIYPVHPPDRSAAKALALLRRLTQPA